MLLFRKMFLHLQYSARALFIATRRVARSFWNSSATGFQVRPRSKSLVGDDIKYIKQLTLLVVFILTLVLKTMFLTLKTIFSVFISLFLFQTWVVIATKLLRGSFEFIVALVYIFRGGFLSFSVSLRKGLLVFYNRLVLTTFVIRLSVRRLKLHLQRAGYILANFVTINSMSIYFYFREIRKIRQQACKLQPFSRIYLYLKDLTFCVKTFFFFLYSAAFVRLKDHQIPEYLESNYPITWADVSTICEAAYQNNGRFFWVMSKNLDTQLIRKLQDAHQLPLYLNKISGEALELERTSEFLLAVQNNCGGTGTKPYLFAEHLYTDVANLFLNQLQETLLDEIKKDPFVLTRLQLTSIFELQKENIYPDLVFNSGLLDRIFNHWSRVFEINSGDFLYLLTTSASPHAPEKLWFVRNAEDLYHYFHARNMLDLMSLEWTMYLYQLYAEVFMSYYPFLFYWGKACSGMGGGVLFPIFAIFGKPFYYLPEPVMIIFFGIWTYYYSYYVIHITSASWFYFPIDSIYEDWYLDFRFDIMHFWDFDIEGEDEYDFFQYFLPWILIAPYIDVKRRVPNNDHIYGYGDYRRYLVDAARRRYSGLVNADAYLSAYLDELSPLMILMDHWHDKSYRFIRKYKNFSNKLVPTTNYDSRVATELEVQQVDFILRHFKRVFTRNHLWVNDWKLRQLYRSMRRKLLENYTLFRPHFWRGYTDLNFIGKRMVLKKYKKKFRLRLLNGHYEPYYEFYHVIPFEMNRRKRSFEKAYFRTVYAQYRSEHFPVKAKKTFMKLDIPTRLSANIHLAQTEAFSQRDARAFGVMDHLSRKKKKSTYYGYRHAYQTAQSLGLEARKFLKYRKPRDGGDIFKSYIKQYQRGSILQALQAKNKFFLRSRFFRTSGSIVDPEMSTRAFPVSRHTDVVLPHMTLHSKGKARRKYMSWAPNITEGLREIGAKDTATQSFLNLVRQVRLRRTYRDLDSIPSSEYNVSRILLTDLVRMSSLAKGVKPYTLNELPLRSFGQHILPKGAIDQFFSQHLGELPVLSPLNKFSQQRATVSGLVGSTYARQFLTGTQWTLGKTISNLISGSTLRNEPDFYSLLNDMNAGESAWLVNSYYKGSNNHFSALPIWDKFKFLKLRKRRKRKKLRSYSPWYLGFRLELYKRLMVFNKDLDQTQVVSNTLLPNLYYHGKSDLVEKIKGRWFLQFFLPRKSVQRLSSRRIAKFLEDRFLASFELDKEEILTQFTKVCAPELFTAIVRNPKDCSVLFNSLFYSTNLFLFLRLGQNFNLVHNRVSHKKKPFDLYTSSVTSEFFFDTSDFFAQRIYGQSEVIEQTFVRFFQKSRDFFTRVAVVDSQRTYVPNIKLGAWGIWDFLPPEKLRDLGGVQDELSRSELQFLFQNLKLAKKKQRLLAELCYRRLKRHDKREAATLRQRLKGFVGALHETLGQKLTPDNRDLRYFRQIDVEKPKIDSVLPISRVTESDWQSFFARPQWKFWHRDNLGTLMVFDLLVVAMKLPPTGVYEITRRFYDLEMHTRILVLQRMYLFYRNSIFAPVYKREYIPEIEIIDEEKEIEELVGVTKNIVPSYYEQIDPKHPEVGYRAKTITLEELPEVDKLLYEIFEVRGPNATRYKSFANNYGVPTKESLKGLWLNKLDSVATNSYPVVQNPLLLSRLRLKFDTIQKLLHQENIGWWPRVEELKPVSELKKTVNYYRIQKIMDSLTKTYKKRGKKDMHNIDWELAKDLPSIENYSDADLYWYYFYNDKYKLPHELKTKLNKFGKKQKRRKKRRLAELASVRAKRERRPAEILFTKPGTPWLVKAERKKKRAEYTQTMWKKKPLKISKLDLLENQLKFSGPKEISVMRSKSNSSVAWHQNTFESFRNVTYAQLLARVYSQINVNVETSQIHFTAPRESSPVTGSTYESFVRDFINFFPPSQESSGLGGKALNAIKDIGVNGMLLSETLLNHMEKDTVFGEMGGLPSVTEERIDLEARGQMRIMKQSFKAFRLSEKHNHTQPGVFKQEASFGVAMDTWYKLLQTSAESQILSQVTQYTPRVATDSLRLFQLYYTLAPNYNTFLAVQEQTLDNLFSFYENKLYYDPVQDQTLLPVERIDRIVKFKEMYEAFTGMPSYYNAVFVDHTKTRKNFKWKRFADMTKFCRILLADMAIGVSHQGSDNYMASGAFNYSTDLLEDETWWRYRHKESQHFAGGRRAKQYKRTWNVSRDSLKELYEQTLLTGVYNVTQLSDSPYLNFLQANFGFAPLDLYGLYSENSLGHQPSDWFDVYDTESNSVFNVKPYLNFEYKDSILLKRFIGYHRPAELSLTAAAEFSLVENIENIMTGFSEMESMVGLEYALTFYWYTYFGMSPGTIVDFLMYGCYWSTNWAHAIYNGTFIESHLDNVIINKPQVDLLVNDSVVAPLRFVESTSSWEQYVKLYQHVDNTLLLDLPAKTLWAMTVQSYNYEFVRMFKLLGRIDDYVFKIETRPRTLLERIMFDQRQRKITGGQISADAELFAHEYDAVRRAYNREQRLAVLTQVFKRVDSIFYGSQHLKEISTVGSNLDNFARIHSRNYCKETRYFGQSLADEIAVKARLKANRFVSTKACILEAVPGENFKIQIFRPEDETDESFIVQKYRSIYPKVRGLQNKNYQLLYQTFPEVRVFRKLVLKNYLGTEECLPRLSQRYQKYLLTQTQEKLLAALKPLLVQKVFRQQIVPENLLAINDYYIPEPLIPEPLLSGYRLYETALGRTFHRVRAPIVATIDWSTTVPKVTIASEGSSEASFNSAQKSLVFRNICFSYQFCARELMRQRQPSREILNNYDLNSSRLFRSDLAFMSDDYRVFKQQEIALASQLTQLGYDNFTAAQGVAVKLPPRNELATFIAHQKAVQEDLKNSGDRMAISDILEDQEPWYSGTPKVRVTPEARVTQEDVANSIYAKSFDPALLSKKFKQAEEHEKQRLARVREERVRERMRMVKKIRES